MRKPPPQMASLTNHLDIGTTPLDDSLTDPRMMKLPDNGSGGFMWIPNIVILKKCNLFTSPLLDLKFFFFQIILKQSLLTSLGFIITLSVISQKEILSSDLLCLMLREQVLTLSV